MRKRMRAIKLAAGLAVLGLQGETAAARIICDGSDVEKHLPPPPKGCQGTRLEVTGRMSFNVFSSPEALGRSAWEREAKKTFGARFQYWANAACRKVDCQAAKGGRRCTFSAFPCAQGVDRRALLDLMTEPVAKTPVVASKTPPGETGGKTKAGTSVGLSKGEVRELQRLLARAGYRVRVDGIAGRQTMRALGQWRRRRDLGRIETPDAQALADLRAALSRGARARSSRTTRH